MHFGDWYVLYILVYSIHVFAAHVWFCWYVSLDVGFGINDLCKQRNIPRTTVLPLRRANFSWVVWHANLHTFRFETL